MKKAAAIFALTMIIFTLCTIPPTKAQEQIYIIINADGTVTPSTAPIQQNGDTYTLTSDFAGRILIQRSDIVLNGAGHSISSDKYGEYGVKLSNVTNVTVQDLVIRGSATGYFYGIALSDSTNCLVTNNTVTDVDSYYWSLYSYEAIHISGGKQNTISQNVLLNNLEGLRIANTSDNLIVGNSIECDHAFAYPRALSLSYATNNHIYHNSFLQVDIVTSAPGSNNTWDNGFPSGGNYWSNYQSHNPNPRKINNSGLLDVAYVIDDENIDNYPLAEPYTAKAPTITITSAGGVYNVSSVPLSFTLDQPASWIGNSLDGAQNVTLTSNQTLQDLENGQHTVKVYANDSFGNMGSAEFEFTVSVPLSPVLIVGVFVLVVAAAVIGGAVYYRYTKASTKHTNPLQSALEPICAFI